MQTMCRAKMPARRISMMAATLCETRAEKAGEKLSGCFFFNLIFFM